MITSEAEARDYCARRCDAEAMARYDAFIPMLVAENQRQNLVANASLSSVWQRHIADSVQLLDHVPRETSPWLDLGTGAGFPGLIIALADPAIDMVLVESRKRRVEWLERVVRDLELTKCRVLGARLESVENFESAIISARAFAPLGKLLTLSARFSTRATVWLLPKGRSGAQELSEQPAGVKSMFHVEQSVTDPSAGIVVGTGRPDLA